MPASSTAYGTTAPSAIDPFSIESVLAKIVGENNPANAQNMLNTYQVENQTSQGNYNYNLQQQHEFAKQQLAQQLQENYMKNAIEAAKTPGALSLLGGLTGGAALGGVDINPLETNLRAAQAAKTAQEGGAATWSLTNAGFQPEEDTARAFTAGLAGPRTAPLPLQVAQLKEAGANARHAAGAGGVGVTVQGPNVPGVGPSNFNFGKNTSFQQGMANLRNRGFPTGTTAVPLPGGGAGSTNTDEDGGGDSEAPPTTPAKPTAPVAPPATPPKGRTNLQAAPVAPTRVESAAQGGGQAQRFANQWVENTVRTQNPQAYADIMANAVNGNVTVVQGPNGLQIVGKRGRY